MVRWILAGTFAVLTTLPLNILYQPGICVAVGILLDTFAVRGLLVPGVVLLLGKWNGWPGKLEDGHFDEVEQENEVSGQVAITGTGVDAAFAMNALETNDGRLR